MKDDLYKKKNCITKGRRSLKESLKKNNVRFFLMNGQMYSTTLMFM